MEFTDSRWNTNHANKFYKEKLNGVNHLLTINNFPRTLQIYDADINIAFNLEKKEILCCTSLGNKLLLHKLITDSTKDNIKKRKLSSNEAIWYNSLDPAVKEKLLSHRAEWYKSLDPEGKKNNIFCLAEQFGINH